VIAGGHDSVLRVWNVTNGDLIASFAPPPAKSFGVKNHLGSSLNIQQLTLLAAR